MKFLVTERQLKTIVNFLNEGLDYEDISGSSNYPKKDLKQNKYFVIHHTAGGKNASGIVDVLNNRKLGVQWIIDREGKIYKSSPGTQAAHVAATKGMGPDDLGNSTAQGVEIIANNDEDVIEDVQCPAALKLIKSLGISPSNVYGHGEVSKHKSPTEGAKCKAYVLKNWGDKTIKPVKTKDTKDGETNNTEKTSGIISALKKFNTIVKNNETINNESDPAKKRILNFFFRTIRKDNKIEPDVKIDDYITTKIKEFQAEKGLPETGIYDDKTIDTIFKDTLINFGFTTNSEQTTNTQSDAKTSSDNEKTKTQTGGGGNKPLANFAEITKRVIDKFEGGYWNGSTPENVRTAKKGICNNHPKGSMGKSTETMFGLDRYNGNIESTPEGKQFFKIIDDEKDNLGLDKFCTQKWKWLYRGGDKEAELKDLAVKIMERSFNRNMSNYVKDNEVKQKILSNPGLLLHMSYASWNGPGFFKKFAKKLTDAIKNGKPDSELANVAIASRAETGLLNKGKVEAQIKELNNA